jgi:hypothetical protein
MDPDDSTTDRCEFVINLQHPTGNEYAGNNTTPDPIHFGDRHDLR